MNIREHNQAIRDLAKELSVQFIDDTVLIVSVANRERHSPAGAVKEVDCQNAARCLVGNTHKLANAEQISAYHQHAENERQRIEQSEFKRRSDALRLRR